MRKIAITMFAFLCFIVSCNVEDNLNSEQDSTITATSKWFDESGVDLPILHYSKTPNWQDAIVSKKGNQTIIEVPLLLDNNFKVQNGDAQTYNRLLFCKDKEGKFEVYHLVLSTSEKFDNNDKNLTFERLLTSFDGNINLVNANQEVVDPVTKTPKKRSSSLTGKEEETCTYLIEMYDDGSYEYRAKLFCGGTGGGTGTTSGGTKTGGAGGSGGTSIEETAPPSCESFNFTSKKGANWQEAAVKNVNFRIVLLTPPNHIQITQVISFPQAISFGMPINYNKGNGDITAGVAATVSARILQLAMDETVAKFGKTETSESTVRLYFQDKLIKEYQEYTNGGRVNFNSTSNISATQYKTNLLSSGNCD